MSDCAGSGGKGAIVTHRRNLGLQELGRQQRIVAKDCRNGEMRELGLRN